MLITSAKKRDKVSKAITSSNFILFSLFGCTTRIYFMLSLSNLQGTEQTNSKLPSNILPGLILNIWQLSIFKK